MDLDITHFFGIEQKWFIQKRFAVLMDDDINKEVKLTIIPQSDFKKYELIREQKLPYVRLKNDYQHMYKLTMFL